MVIEKTNLVRITANKDKSLKWKEYTYNPYTRQYDIIERYAEAHMLIDLNKVIGEIEEIEIEEYQEWYGKNKYSLGIGLL